MKNTLLLLCFLAAMMAVKVSAQNNSVNNTWSGRLKVPNFEITLVFHLDSAKCTIDSPDQGVKGIPATMECTSMGVKVTVPSINASYEGINMGKSIMGTFKQHGQSFPLTLTSGELKRQRPQTPVAPYPYQTQQVSFTNGGATLKGTLVLPEGCSRQTPVLLMVTGSGFQDRDESIFEHKPFAVIADALARQGIATLRYDDRGFAESTGDIVNMTTEDLKRDALAGIELLRQQFDHVGLIGHSEGGTIGLMLAAEHQVDFVVSLAGMVVSGKQTLLQQNQWTLLKAGYSQEVTDSYCKALESVFDELKVGRIPQLSSQGLPSELEKNLQMVIVQSSTPYMRYFLAMDVSDSLAKITCPVLALNGTKDCQVFCEDNLQLLRMGLSGKKAIHALEGLNHMFQHCTTGDPSEYKDIEETFAHEALAIIADWLKDVHFDFTLTCSHDSPQMPMCKGLRAREGERLTLTSPSHFLLRSLTFGKKVTQNVRET